MKTTHVYDELSDRRWWSRRLWREVDVWTWHARLGDPSAAGFLGRNKFFEFHAVQVTTSLPKVVNKAVQAYGFQLIELRRNLNSTLYCPEMRLCSLTSRIHSWWKVWQVLYINWYVLLFSFSTLIGLVFNDDIQQCNFLVPLMSEALSSFDDLHGLLIDSSVLLLNQTPYNSTNANTPCKTGPNWCTKFQRL